MKREEQIIYVVFTENMKRDAKNIVMVKLSLYLIKNYVMKAMGGVDA
jgi:hypothetical protein